MATKTKKYWYLDYHSIGDDISMHSVYEFTTLAAMNKYLENHSNEIDYINEAEYRERLTISLKQFQIKR